MKKSNTSIFYKIAFLLVLFISMPTILASTLFFFGISINSYTFIIGELLSILVYIFFFVYKNKDSNKETLIVFLSTLVLIFIAFLLVYNIYDRSYDGNAYHMRAIDWLSSGWNPVYNHIEDVNGIGIFSAHYPKFIWTFAATIMSLTGNILIGKMFTIVIIYITALIAYDVLKRTRILNPIFAFIFSILISLNPVIIPQINTYYNDGILGNLIIIVCFLLYGVTKKVYNIEKDYTVLIFIGLLASILANIKYTGALYIVVILSIYWIFLLLGKLIENKKMFFVKSAVIIGFLVCTVAANTYLINIVHHKNIGYPIVGENKIDIKTSNTPEVYKDKNKFLSFFESNLTYSNNSRQLDDFTYKAPFTATKEEVKQLSVTDLRTGGFGVYFQLILLSILFISIIIILKEITNKKIKNLISYLNNFREKYKEELIFLFIGLVLFIITPMLWWARYVPYFYSFLLIFFIFIISNYKEVIYKNLAIIIIIFLCSLNTFAFIVVDYSEVTEASDKIENKLEVIVDSLSKEKKIYLTEPRDPFNFIVSYTLDNNNIDYEYVDLDGNYKVIKELPYNVKVVEKI